MQEHIQGSAESYILYSGANVSFLLLIIFLLLFIILTNIFDYYSPQDHVEILLIITGLVSKFSHCLVYGLNT